MKSRLNTSVLSSPEVKKTVECEICSKSLSNKTQLARHISAIHEGKKPFKCAICDYSSSRKGDMKRHVESVHEGKSHSSVTFVTTAVLKRVT